MTPPPRTNPTETAALPVADICLLIEGTYPYVSGGVSSWVHSLITNLRDFTFTLVHLGAQPDASRVAQYRLPENVIGQHDLFLHDLHTPAVPPPKRRTAREWAEIRTLHERLAAGETAHCGDIFRHLAGQNPHGLGPADLLFSGESWDLLVERYQQRAPESAFRDFFWTFRATHAPLFKLLETPLPPARLYHAPSAGFSGLLGALAKMRTGAPFLVTEHGIYTHERALEIGHADWIPGTPAPDYRLEAGHGFFKEWWTQMFRFMTRTAYDTADEIISITQSNQRYQLHDGAAPEKMRVIPNGIATERFGGVRAGIARQGPGFHVGFVGRVVPIKDVKTFIRAIGIAAAAIPDLTVSVVGPTEEDPAYFAECQQLVAMLGLESIITFTGRADVRDYYATLDVVVLTSLSEAQPLVILEANCAGVPVIASDVGACHELLFGITQADRALGASGLLTAVRRPEETAAALVRLAGDEELRQTLARAGQRRVRECYREEQLYAAYRALYQKYIAQSPARAA